MEQKDYVVRISGKRYVIRMKYLFDYINYSGNHMQSEREITEQYDPVETDDGTMTEVTTKIVREVTSPSNTQMDSIKYDLVKMFIGKLIDIDTDDDMELTFGERIVIDTLIAEKLIEEIN